MVQGGAAMAPPRRPRALLTAVALCASVAVAAVVCLSLPATRPDGPGELFGPAQQTRYGPVDYSMDPAMQRALKEYENHGGSIKRGGTWGARPALSQTRQTLGPRADAMLRSGETDAALREYRDAPRDVQLAQRQQQAPTQQLSEEGQEGHQQAQLSERRQGGGSAVWASAWHPGRVQDARGSGESLLRSKGTQEALREMREHTGGAKPAPEREALAQAKPSAGHILLAAKGKVDAGFTQVRNRGQALEAIRDLLNERLGSVGQQTQAKTDALSMAHGLKVERARLSGLVQSIARTERDMREIKDAQRGREERGEGGGGAARGRTIGKGYRAVEHKMTALREAIARKEQEVQGEEREERRLGGRARLEQQRALAAQREEMSRYGKADMARSSAEGFAHKLLAEKARARLLAGRVAHGEARARQYERDGRRLKEQSKKEERDFEHMAGPVHKARAAVKLANNAYDAATMRLASAETAGASAPAGDAKVRAEAAAKVAEDRKLVRHMEGLVRGATERLARVEGKNGPLTGLDSHFEGPKRRAVRELAKARRVRDGLRRDRQREQVLREDVEGELPQLKRNMRRAKVLHKSYEEARERAIKAERSAGEAERALSSAQARLSGDEQRAQGLQTALRAAEQGVGRELESAYEGDWRSLAEMHQELINDKEQYSKARRLSCGAGGPCPKETGDGLPRRVHA